jgi:hypothetical protein
MSRIVPIPKKPSPSSPNDLRPIAIQPVLTNLLEKCLIPSLTSYLEENNLMAEKCSEKGTLQTMLLEQFPISCTKAWIRDICIAVTIDKVDRDVLIHKLKWYGISTGLIDSLLSDRSQFVSLKCECDDKVSFTKTTQLGVPQGGCLSCVLFSLMINDLCLVFKHSLPVLYADDDTVLIAGPPDELISIINLLEADLSRAVAWIDNSRLSINDEKTEIMFIGKTVT